VGLYTPFSECKNAVAEIIRVTQRRFFSRDVAQISHNQSKAQNRACTHQLDGIVIIRKHEQGLLEVLAAQRHYARSCSSPQHIQDE